MIPAVNPAVTQVNSGKILSNMGPVSPEVMMGGIQKDAAGKITGASALQISGTYCIRIPPHSM